MSDSCPRILALLHFLLSCTVVQADGEPPLTPIPEVSSMLETTSTISGGDASLQHSFWTMPSADGVHGVSFITVHLVWTLVPLSIPLLLIPMLLVCIGELMVVL